MLYWRGTFFTDGTSKAWSLIRNGYFHQLTLAVNPGNSIGAGAKYGCRLLKVLLTSFIRVEKMAVNTERLLLLYEGLLQKFGGVALGKPTQSENL